jgi:hypothetical protein
MRTLGLIFAAIMVAGFAARAVSQEAKLGAAPRGEAVEPLVFYPFTFWQKLQFGATSLVNPETAEQATILYSYDPGKVMNATTWDSIAASSTIAKETGPAMYEMVTAEEAEAVARSLRLGEMVDPSYKVLTPTLIGGSQATTVIAWPE